jgi:hypothetical protein
VDQEGPVVLVEDRAESSRGLELTLMVGEGITELREVVPVEPPEAFQDELVRGADGG